MFCPFTPQATSCLFALIPEPRPTSSHSAHLRHVRRAVSFSFSFVPLLRAALLFPHYLYFSYPQRLFYRYLLCPHLLAIVYTFASLTRMSTKSTSIKFRCDPRTRKYLTFAARASNQSISEFLIEGGFMHCRLLISSGRWKAKSPPPQVDARKKAS